MNLQMPIDLLLEKILGVGYDQNHVIVFIGLIIILILVLKGAKKK